MRVCISIFMRAKSQLMSWIKEGKRNQGGLIEPCWSDRNLHPKVKRKG